MLNFEKCRFMVTKGIILVHLVSSKGIEVVKPRLILFLLFPIPHICVKFVLFLDL